MTKVFQREVTKTIRQKREQLQAIRNEIEDLIDYLEVLEARVRDKNKPRLTHGQVMKHFNLK
ncbi:MAG TPA: hypothetical protein VJM12_00145 [Pyrinomonadaceae bacterium]|nr:hypothetical protein [Pyrinomonadaceae bacterium]